MVKDIYGERVVSESPDKYHLEQRINAGKDLGILTKVGVENTTGYVVRHVVRKGLPMIFDGFNYNHNNLQDQVDARFFVTCRILLDAVVIALRPDAEPHHNKLAALLALGPSLTEDKKLLAAIVHDVTKEAGAQVHQRRLRQVAADLLAAAVAPLPPMEAEKQEVLKNMLLYLGRRSGVEAGSVEDLLGVAEDVIVDGSYKVWTKKERDINRSLEEAEKEFKKQKQLDEINANAEEWEF